MSAREIEQRLVAIVDVALTDGKYRPSLLTAELRAEYRRLYPLWLRSREDVLPGELKLVAGERMLAEDDKKRGAA